MEKNFILHGNICYTPDPDTLVTGDRSYLVCESGRSAGIYSEIPEKYSHFPVKDWGDRLIIPGLVDLHLHAPQYTFRGLGMDMELLDWLEVHAFPEEARYADEEYARSAYAIFVEGLRKSATTRACMFGTLHREASLILMDLLEESGLVTMVGKVNMDRNSPDILRETTEESISETKRWIEETIGRYERTKPILTPRFTPSCTDRLMEGLGELQREYDLPVQSHLSENLKEIAWVKELCPWAACYGDAYDRFGLFGPKTIMAHCVWPDEHELQLMQERGVYVAHCPTSNSNIGSGIAPARLYLDREMPIGIGSDVAGGDNESLFRVMTEVIKDSKLRWRLVDESLKPLTMVNALYMATKGGGAFFGKVGSFEEGYEFDALVLDDARLPHTGTFTTAERLERLIYLTESSDLKAKYAAGRAIFS